MTDQLVLSNGMQVIFLQQSLSISSKDCKVTLATTLSKVRMILISVIVLFGDLYLGVNCNTRFRYFFVAIAEMDRLCYSFRSKVVYDSGSSVLQNCCNSGSLVNFQGNLLVRIFYYLLTSTGYGGIIIRSTHLIYSC